MHYIIIALIFLVLCIFIAKIVIYKNYSDHLNKKFSVNASKLKFALFRTVLTIASLFIFMGLAQLTDFAILILPILPILNWFIAIALFYNKSSEYSFSVALKASLFGVLVSIKAYLIATVAAWVLVNILAISTEIADHGLEEFSKKHLEYKKE